MKLSEAEITELVQRLIDCEGSMDEQHQWLEQIAANVPMPLAEVSGLIYTPEDGKLPLARDVVEKALSYKPNVIRL